MKGLLIGIVIGAAAVAELVYGSIAAIVVEAHQ
jgi:hypothetical protein